MRKLRDILEINPMVISKGSYLIPVRIAKGYIGNNGFDDSALNFYEWLKFDHPFRGS